MGNLWCGNGDLGEGICVYDTECWGRVALLGQESFVTCFHLWGASLGTRASRLFQSILPGSSLIECGHILFIGVGPDFGPNTRVNDILGKFLGNQ